jgi:hypothetical protein
MFSDELSLSRVRKFMESLTCLTFWFKQLIQFLPTFAMIFEVFKIFNSFTERR